MATFCFGAFIVISPRAVPQGLLGLRRIVSRGLFTSRNNSVLGKSRKTVLLGLFLHHYIERKKEFYSYSSRHTWFHGYNTAGINW